MSHTKGPWYVGAMNDALFIIDRPPAHFTDNGVREGGDTNVIASIKILDRGVDDANASLIAAAPQMWAELQSAPPPTVAAYRTPEDFFEAYEEWYRRTREVLKRVEGAHDDGCPLMNEGGPCGCW